MMPKPAACATTLALLAVASLTLGSPDQPAGPGPQTDLPRGMILLPNGKSLEVQVADTPRSREIGYMFTPKVPEGEGMLFFMERLDIHYFWMKNCLTALDIIWIDENWKIVHVEASVPPCEKDPCPSYAPMWKSLYILEVGPGRAEAMGLRAGERITFVPPKPPAEEPARP